MGIAPIKVHYYIYISIVIAIIIIIILMKHFGYAQFPWTVSHQGRELVAFHGVYIKVIIIIIIIMAQSAATELAQHAHQLSTNGD